MTKRSNAKENGRIEVVLCWEMTATSDQRSITCPTTTVGKKRTNGNLLVERGKRWKKRDGKREADGKREESNLKHTTSSWVAQGGQKLRRSNSEARLVIGPSPRLETVGDPDEPPFTGGDLLVGAPVARAGNDAMLPSLTYRTALGVSGWKTDEIVGSWSCWMLPLIRCRKSKCINIDASSSAVCVKGKGARHARLH